MGGRATPGFALLALCCTLKERKNYALGHELRKGMVRRQACPHTLPLHPYKPVAPQFQPLKQRQDTCALLAAGCREGAVKVLVSGSWATVQETACFQYS